MTKENQKMGYQNQNDKHKCTTLKEIFQVLPCAGDDDLVDEAFDDEAPVNPEKSSHFPALNKLLVKWESLGQGLSFTTNKCNTEST